MSKQLKWLGYILFPLVLLYTFAVYLRNKFYDWGWKQSCRPGMPVLSVGNIQLGGTGKTPFVQFLASRLKAMGHRPAILTRGYRREGSGTVLLEAAERNEADVRKVGDEPYLLHRNLPGVVLGIDGDRCRAARRIAEKYDDLLLLMDDGLQHRRMERDLDIVLIDVSRWSSLPLLFPVSDFRDVKSTLKRAGIFVLTRTAGREDAAQRLSRKLQEKYRKPVFRAQIMPVRLRSLDGRVVLNAEAIRGKKVAAFCGLAHPPQFFAMLRKLGAIILWKKAYRDHYDYQAPDVENIFGQAAFRQADYVVTTQKDAVKIPVSLLRGQQQIYCLEIGVSLEKETEFFKRLLSRLPALPGEKEKTKNKNDFDSGI